MNPIEEKLNSYKEDFKWLADDNDKVEFIIEMGKKNQPLPPEKKNDETLVKGCSSKAWLVMECRDGVVHMEAEGESALAKGMIALLPDLYNDRKAEDILAFDPKKLYDLGLDALLSPVRQQGLEAFLGYVYGFAQKCKEQSDG
jgi:cysteine desulfuration protein SufE